MTAIGIDDTSSLIVKGSDGYYHYITAEGPIVVVQISGTINGLYDKNFLELDFEGGSPYSFNITPADELDDYTKDYQILNYTRFLRGYASPVTDASGNVSAPTEYEVEVFYAKYLNSDGVYPLTDELITFLKYYVYGSATDTSSLSAAGSLIQGALYGSDNSSVWLFSAFYYDDGTPLPVPAPTSGDGTESSPYVVGIGSYSIEVPASGYIYVTFESSSVSSATIAVSDESVTLSASSVNLNEVFTLTSGDGQSHTVVITVTKISHSIGGDLLDPQSGSGTNTDPYVLTETGLYQVTVESAGSGVNGDTASYVYYRFTATSSGYYTITLNSVNGDLLDADGTYLLEGSTTYSFTLSAGESFDFILTALSTPLTYTFTIVME